MFSATSDVVTPFKGSTEEAGPLFVSLLLAAFL